MPPSSASSAVRDLLRLTDRVLAARPTRAPLLVLRDAWAQLGAGLALADHDAQVERLSALGGAAVAALAATYRAGDISRDQFVARATDELAGHAETAGRLGASQYGEPDDFDPSVLDGLSDRLDGFADTAADDGFSDAQVAAWALMLGGAVYSVFQRGRGDGAEAAGLTTVTWRCRDDKASCDPCIALAEGSPYAADELPTYPGEDVDCGGNCRCGLEFSGGDEGE